jgi:SAM-dependent methyltransferase
MTLFVQLRAAGIVGIVTCLAKKLRYVLLARRHGFDPWHAKSPYECRGYKREVVLLAENLGPQTVVEIGCGLGEIVSRVRDSRRFGFDIDARVVPAARELNGADCSFECAGLADVDTIRNTIGDAGADLLVMVNWPHSLPWPELASHTNWLAKALTLKYLIIDTIAPGIPGYPYHHSLAELLTLGDVLQSHPSIDGVRTLHIISLNAP